MLTCKCRVQRHLAVEPQVYITHFVEAFPDMKARPTLTAAGSTDLCSRTCHAHWCLSVCACEATQHALSCPQHKLSIMPASSISHSFPSQEAVQILGWAAAS